MGSVAKSYMRKCFLIYEEMRKYLTIYEDCRQSYMTLQPLLLNFLLYEGKLDFLFISVETDHQLTHHDGTVVEGLLVGQVGRRRGRILRPLLLKPGSRVFELGNGGGILRRRLRILGHAGGVQAPAGRGPTGRGSTGGLLAYRIPMTGPQPSKGQSWPARNFSRKYSKLNVNILYHPLYGFFLLPGHLGGSIEHCS